MPQNHPPTVDNVFLKTNDIFVPRIPCLNVHDSDKRNLLFLENNDTNIVLQCVGNAEPPILSCINRFVQNYTDFVASHNAKLINIDNDIQVFKVNAIEFIRVIKRLEKDIDNIKHNMIVALLYFGDTHNNVYQLLVGSPLYEVTDNEQYQSLDKQHIEQTIAWPDKLAQSIVIQ